MGRYQRRTEEVDAMMVEAYVSGVSQRKMGDVTEALLGERVGRSTVSRVAKRLDEAVEALRSAPIEGAQPYLYLDATFLDARWARKVENVSALVAYAVGPDGHRRLLGITPLGPEESQDSWSELLEQLLERVLSGVKHDDGAQDQNSSNCEHDRPPLDKGTEFSQWPRMVLAGPRAPDSVHNSLPADEAKVSRWLVGSPSGPTTPARLIYPLTAIPPLGPTGAASWSSCCRCSIIASGRFSSLLLASCSLRPCRALPSMSMTGLRPSRGGGATSVETPDTPDPRL